REVGMEFGDRALDFFTCRMKPGQRLCTSRKKILVGHELRYKRRDSGFGPSIDTNMPTVDGRNVIRALKNYNSRVSATRRRCHPTFPHAVIPIFVRRRVDEDNGLCLP